MWVDNSMVTPPSLHPHPPLLSPPLPFPLFLPSVHQCESKKREEREEREEKGARQEKKSVSHPPSSKHTGQNVAIGKITA